MCVRLWFMTPGYFCQATSLSLSVACLATKPIILPQPERKTQFKLKFLWIPDIAWRGKKIYLETCWRENYNRLFPIQVLMCRFVFHLCHRLRFHSEINCMGLTWLSCARRMWGCLAVLFFPFHARLKPCPPSSGTYPVGRLVNELYAIKHHPLLFAVLRIRNFWAGSGSGTGSNKK